MHVNSTLAQGLQILMAAVLDQAGSAKVGTASKAAPVSNSIVPLSSATKNISGQIGAAMFDLSSKSTSRAPAGMTAVSEDFGNRPMSDEEFQAEVIASVRSNIKLNSSLNPSESAYDKAFAKAFEEAVAGGTLSIRRAQEVDGLDYKQNQTVRMMDGRVVGGGSAPTYNWDFIRADLDKGKNVQTGWINGVGSFYMTFDMPDYLKQVLADR